MGPRGGVVTQRSAKPCTPVQFWSWPPPLIYGDSVKSGRLPGALPVAFGRSSALGSRRGCQVPINGGLLPIPILQCQFRWQVRLWSWVRTPGGRVARPPNKRPPRGGQVWKEVALSWQDNSL